MDSEIEAECDESWDDETWWKTRNRMTTVMSEDSKHWHVMIQAGTLCSVGVDRCEKVKNEE